MHLGQYPRLDGKQITIQVCYFHTTRIHSLFRPISALDVAFAQPTDPSIYRTTSGPDQHLTR